MLPFSSVTSTLLAALKLGAVLGLWMLAYQAAQASQTDSHSFHAALNQGFLYQEQGATWLRNDDPQDQGLGRYAHGSDEQKLAAFLGADLEYRYRPSKAWLFSVHAQARASSPSRELDSLALIEWRGRWRKQFDFHRELRFTFGQFFLPTSFENTQRYWDSPYTLTYSAWNSWIGEEFRPIGVDTEFRYHLESGSRLSIAASLFGGNDSMGALLAYRGFSYGRLRAGLGEVLPLPNLASLADDGRFKRQRDDGTKPFGPDLDDRLGISLRAQYLSDRLLLRLSHVDNRGDGRLYRGEYAWATQFTSVGASWFASPKLELLFEASTGSSAMGLGPALDIDFYSAYGLASYLVGDMRFSYRYEVFGVDNRDQFNQGQVIDESQDFGRSHTLAMFWYPAESASLGLEVLYLSSKRLRHLENTAFAKDRDSVSLAIMLSYHFD